MTSPILSPCWNQEAELCAGAAFRLLSNVWLWMGYWKPLRDRWPLHNKHERTSFVFYGIHFMEALLALINHTVSVVTVVLHCGLHQLWGEWSGQRGSGTVSQHIGHKLVSVAASFVWKKKKPSSLTRVSDDPDSRFMEMEVGLKCFETTKNKNSSYLDSIGPQGLLTAQKVEHLRLWGQRGIWCRHTLLMFLLWMSPSPVSLLCWGEISLLLKD